MISGVRIALDDFGTGYSSLNYLRAFPFDKIKIDRCFVENIDLHSDSQAIVTAVTGLANSLGMTTTAEGVETQEQMDQLRLQGCTEVQGYFFSRPSKVEEFTDLRGHTKKGQVRHDTRHRGSLGGSRVAMLPVADIAEQVPQKKRA